MKILVAASYAGAANALLPVIRRLQTRPEVQLRVIAERQALQLFQGRQIPVEEAPPEPEEREWFLRSLFREGVPDALLLGTSWGPSIEKGLLRIGQERGIPALSVVDHWSNYRERFREPDSGQLRLPHRIALMDTHALEQAVAEGLPREILEVTGQPHLQSLARTLREPELRRKARELRDRWLCAAEGPLLLFCSEYFSDPARRGTPRDRGYTEVDALEGLAEALDSLDGAQSLRPKLVVKLHPKESPDRFQPGSRTRRRGFLLAQAEPAWESLLAADLLVGMTSMLLVEGAVAGRSAISYQPAHGIAVPFVGTEMGIVRAARTVEDLAAHLSNILSTRYPVSDADGGGRYSSPAEEHPFLLRILSGDAAARIEELLLEVACESPVQPHP